MIYSLSMSICNYQLHPSPPRRRSAPFVACMYHHSRKIDEKITADSDEEADTVQEQSGKELVESPSAAWVSHDYLNQWIIADPDEESDMVKEKKREESFDSPSGII